jgi:hypothetical protein
MNENRWRKSTYSSSNGGNCIEVGQADRVLVRDTRQAGTGPVLRFSPDGWRRFAGQVKRSLASDPGPGSADTFRCPLSCLKTEGGLFLSCPTPGRVAAPARAQVS